MDWFRKHIRLGARLALLSFAIQLVLSFGHVHAAVADPGAGGATAELGARALTAESLTDLIAAAVDHEFVAPGDAENQPDHPPAQKSADDCAICAVLALAGTVLFAQPPVLLLPDAIDFLYQTTDAGFAHLDPAHPAFQPRAPPLS